jgi:endonuclease/exonuclease/phosphatase family metal-dependent hydrolase
MRNQWAIYKQYRTDGEHTKWSFRKALLERQISNASADVVCFQECSPDSVCNDLDFMQELGYDGLVQEKKGDQRPATFWKSDRIHSVATFHTDRALVTAFKLVEEPDNMFWVVNAHLSAGPNADRRLRQAEEALKKIVTETKKMKIAPGEFGLACIFCGDMNSQGRTAVDQFLVNGQVGPDFREAGSPFEEMQQCKHITQKVKQQSVGRFVHAARAAFGEGDMVSMLLPNLVSKMLDRDGSLTPAVVEGVNLAFDRFCAEDDTMDKAAIQKYVSAVNPEEGIRYYMDGVGNEYGPCNVERWTREDFHQRFHRYLTQGHFWLVEYELRTLNGSGIEVPSEGPCKLCFDHLYFTQALTLVGVQDPLTSEQKRRVWGPPWDVLPNEWHPSDHLPVAAAFTFTQRC